MNIYIVKCLGGIHSVWDDKERAEIVAAELEQGVVIPMPLMCHQDLAHFMEGRDK